MMRKFGC